VPESRPKSRQARTAAVKTATRRATSQPSAGNGKTRSNGSKRAATSAPVTTASGNGTVSEEQLEDLLEALMSAKKGDFSTRMSLRRKGIMRDIAANFNDLVEMNAMMVKEFSRIRRVIGREGRMQERAQVPSASGDWNLKIDAINDLIDDLVRPTTEIARVMDAVADGDLSQKMALEIGGQPVKGEFLRIGTTVNAMVDQLSSFADEVTRVAREVGTEGQLGGQAEVRGVSGTWKDLTDSVNQMASNLTDQVRNIAQVTTAVANGDLTQKITVDVKGEILELKNTMNTMVDQLSSFADEVTRVAREVGTEGKLGGQARVEGVSGTWRDLTENVNVMASNLTTQVRNIAQVATAVANGDLTQKITVEAKGEVAELAETINSMTDTLNTFAEQVIGVAREVGTEGKLGSQADVPGVAGTWKDLTENVNLMAANLTDQVRNIAQVTTAVANGDLGQKITVDVKGEFLELKRTINTMVDQLSSFADEVTRVAREVGTEGKLGGQARVEGVSGTWRDLTENVNLMASNLTDQVRNIAQVATAVAEGDLTQKIEVEARGEVAALADTINSMTDTLQKFAEQVTGVAREVGTEGILGGQADVPGAAGTWKDLTDNVNFMASNLTTQVRNISQVASAVAEGDLTQKITVEAKGEVAELAETMNSMTDTLQRFADEVTRVAREVGTDGKLGGQAEVEGVAGTWKGLTDSVNQMASNLTDQVRNIAQVTTAVARGDLTQKITVDVKGEILELKNTMNTMVDQLSSFADEVTRVAREVGTEGQLGGQAEVKGVSGTWRDLTENVNVMASNLTTQVRTIAQVTTAVANGDLSQKVEVETKGEVAQLADTINRMVDQLRSFAAEVTRVAREVGTEGKLGGQAEVEGVAGTWRDLTENVNLMASNLTDQVRNIADVATAVASGDLSQKITVDARGEILDLKETLNTMVDQLRSFAAEVTRVAREVGTEGRLGGQAEVEGVSGTWRGLTESVNMMASNLTDQVRSIAQVTTAIANGDLSKKITVEAQGEILELRETINTMVEQLRSFAAEVTRVAREVGTEGKLGGQAEVEGVAGTWRGLTENVNLMASNLTDQVRNIAMVATAVASGDLGQKITVDARGEILQLKNTLNTMVDQLSSFADEVTRVAREVGTEGKLGGQAEVEGVSGTWRDLTENVNQLASNLTTQVRAIAEVSTAVTQGDLTRQITVEAQGEVAELKDNINQMIANLRETTQRNEEQDWLKTNLARISGLMQGQRDLGTVSRMIMSELTPTVSAQLGAFYMAENDNGDEEKTELRLVASYGYKKRKSVSNNFKAGEGLVGQALLERIPIIVDQAPTDYVRISSGLGEGDAANIIVLPVIFEDQVLAVIELASFRTFSETHLTFLEQLMETIGVVLNTLIANMRTEELLEQSQSLTKELQSQSEELQSRQEELSKSNKELEEQAKSLKASEEMLQQQQEELQQTNEELQEKAALLERQNRDIEIKNREIELARASLEERAEQLSLSSKYKSEFLANMSHELRTPLNSLLILSKMLGDNSEQNLTEKQVEFAKTIHNAGSDLLGLINDILDLSKVEAGKMDVHVGELGLAVIADYVERTFRPVADEKKLEFEIEVADGLPASITTDEQRLQQIIRNLLSNAFKFTEKGNVSMRIAAAPAEHVFANDALGTVPGLLAISVTDTGIGIPEDKLRLIFESFQQADGGTSRKYGGTGLGLSISREIARLLGGEIQVQSQEGEGSTFTLYLPPTFVSRDSQPAIDTSAFDGRATNGAGVTGSAEAVAAAPPRRSGRAIIATNGGADPALLAQDEIKDDRDLVQPGDAVCLIVEGEAPAAQSMLERVRAAGMKGLVAFRPDAGIAVARNWAPDAIVLNADLKALQQLKQVPETRHIPVYVVGTPELRQDALQIGAAGYLEMPVADGAVDAALEDVKERMEQRVKRVLVVDDNDIERDSIGELIGSGDDVEIISAASSEEALEALETETRIDCIVLDLKLPKMTGFQLLEKIGTDERFQHIPVIVHTGKELTRREETKLRKYAKTIVVKDVRSPDRLLAETALFLHRPQSSMPAEQRRMLEEATRAEVLFAGKKVLLVDDDVRNLFALASALESRGLEIVFAENGREGLEALKQNPEIDLVLMDLMMPEMDGYEAMRALREMEQFKSLPIIALTAKAMKGDREESIAAGASDYITKPVDIEQLLSLMQVWLYQ
jgi:HAMP domain-containing protein/signal transduction histidine kinase/CheY-like chemotaxis protein